MSGARVVRVGGTTIEVHVGDLTRANAEAIVNAANTDLWMGGGVAGAIKRAAGEEVQREAMAKGPIQPGQSIATGSGRLAPLIHAVIHAATMGSDLITSEEYIRAATASALAEAVEIGARSIAFPALGTGVGHFPIERAAELMVGEAVRVAQAGTPIEEIIFVMRSDAARQAFEAALDAAL
jgi:O-acetyl-ADP-ribose deacetylase (regulator of RNase III)